MPSLKDRLVFKLCLSLGCLMCLTLMGCTDNAGDEYQTYQSLEQSDRSGDNTVGDGSAEAAEVVDQQSSVDAIAERNESPSIATPELPPVTDNWKGDPQRKSDNSSEGGIAASDLTENGTFPSENEPITPELASDAESGPPNDLPAGDPNLLALADEPVEQREIKLLIPEKSFTAEGDADAIRVSYDDINLLDILNMEPVPINPDEYFPDWLAGLEGRRIRIRGFMYPTFLSTGLRTFVLVRDNQECCFGPGAKIYDHIQVYMRDGVTADYIEGRAFDVEGVFNIDPEADGDELFQLYLLEDSILLGN